MRLCDPAMEKLLFPIQEVEFPFQELLTGPLYNHSINQIMVLLNVPTTAWTS